MRTRNASKADGHIRDGLAANLAVLYEPEDVLKAVVVQEDSLEGGPIRALQDLGYRVYKREQSVT